MSACGRFHEWMVEGLYGELDEARLREFDDHLGACSKCAALYDELRATVRTMSRRRRPDPGAVFWDGYWRRLEERGVRDEAVVDASRFGRRRSLGSWGYRAAAAVVVLAAGVWIGRTALQTAPRTADRAPEIAHTPAAGDEALRYIGRSQVVLLALLNGDNGEVAPAGYTSERAQARVLVAEGRRLQDGLTRPEDRRLRELIGQLEMILREIANLEADNDLDAVEMIRNRVDRQGVLLQIDLRQMREASVPGNDGNADDQEY